MSHQAPLTSEQFATLRAISEVFPPAGLATPFAALGVLLRLNYIRAENDGYAPTAAGMLRISCGA